MRNKRFIVLLMACILFLQNSVGQVSISRDTLIEVFAAEQGFEEPRLEAESDLEADQGAGQALETVPEMRSVLVPQTEVDLGAGQVLEIVPEQRSSQVPEIESDPGSRQITEPEQDLRDGQITEPEQDLEDVQITEPGQDLEDGQIIESEQDLEDGLNPEDEGEENDEEDVLNTEDTSLKVRVFTSENHNKTAAGEEIDVHILTQFAAPTDERDGEDGCATVRIPIPNDKVLITNFTSNSDGFTTGFDDKGEYRAITIISYADPLPNAVEYKLYGKDGTSDRFIEYEVSTGSVEYVLFVFLFPNGIIENESLALIPESNYRDGEPDYQSMEGMVIDIESSFNWNPVELNYGPGLDVVDISTPANGMVYGTLAKDIEYEIAATSQNAATGSIYTQKYTIEDTVKFPKGVFTLGDNEPQRGTWYNSNNEPIISTVDSDTVIIPVFDSEYVVGFIIELIKYNESYIRYCNNEIYITELREIDSPKLAVILHGKNLHVDIPLFNTMFSNGISSVNVIENNARFTALPIAGSSEHESNAQVMTTIPMRPAVIKGSMSSETTSIVTAGETIEYKIVVENTGLGDKVVDVENVIPSGTTFISAGGDYQLVYKEPESVISSVRWTVMVKGQERVTLTLIVTVDSDVMNGFIISNNAIVDGQSTNIVTHKTPDPAISFLKTTDRDISEIVRAGEDITYTITVTNTGDGNGRAIIVDEVPEGTVFVNNADNNPDGGVLSVDGKSLTWVLILPANSVMSVSFTVRIQEDVANGYIISNTALVNSMLTNKIDLRTPDSNVSISKAGAAKNEFADDDERVRPNEIITYTITLENTGGGNGLVSVRDIIAPGITLIPESITFFVNGVEEISIPHQIKGTTLSWDNIFILTGDLVEIVFDARVTVQVDGTEIKNQAILNVRGTDKFSNDVTHRVIAPILSFSMDTDPPINSTINGGSTITYFITIKNTGGDACEARIVSTIPAETTLITDPWSVILDGQPVDLNDILSEWLADGVIEYVTIVPPRNSDGSASTVEFSFQVMVGDIVDGYRIEQISYVNELNSQTAYHISPLPVFTQQKSAAVYHYDEDNNLIKRENNIFNIKGGTDTTVFDPDTDKIINYDKNTITYVFEGDVIIYTIDVFNYGLGYGKAIISDRIPYGTAFVDNLQNNPHGGILDTSSGMITWEKKVKPAVIIGYDESENPIIEPYKESVSFSVTVNGNLRNGYNIANQAKVNTEATNRIDLYLPTADVRIEKTAETELNKNPIESLPNRPQPVGLGETITYTITLTNEGLADGLVRVRDQLPPGVIYKGAASNGATNLTGVPIELKPEIGGTSTTTLTWDNVVVRGLAGIEGSGIPAVELVFEVKVYGQEEYQELVNSMMGRNEDDSEEEDGPDYGPASNSLRDENFPTHPDGVDINDTEEIFNYAVLTDLVDGKNDKFSKTVRHMVVRPIFSYTLSAIPKDGKNIEEVNMFGSGVEEGDKFYYFIDVANSGHDSGIATIYSQIPALTIFQRERAYIVTLDEEGNEISDRIYLSDDDFYSEKGLRFTDKNGKNVLGIVYEMEVSAKTVMRFAFEVEVGQVYDGFRIEETAWVNKLRSRSIYHYTPIPKVTIAKSASRHYADERVEYGDDIPNEERQFQTLWPNGNLVPFPWEWEDDPDTKERNYTIGSPSSLSNGVPHKTTIENGTVVYDPYGPTVVRPGERFTYYITLWSESSRSVVDVVDVLPPGVKPVKDSARILKINDADLVDFNSISITGNTVRWNGIHLPRTTNNMNIPVVLAIDVVVQIPYANGIIISNDAKGISIFNQPDGSLREVDCISNTVEHVVIRNSSNIVKTGKAQYGNDPYVQLGERIDYTITMGNSSVNSPDNFEVTDTLDSLLVDMYGTFSLADTISAVVRDKDGNVVLDADTVRTFITDSNGTIILEPLVWVYDPSTCTITWTGGLKPGETVEMRFSAIVNPNYIISPNSVNKIQNYAILNEYTASNVVEHLLVSRGFTIEKRNNIPANAGLLPGDHITYTITVSNSSLVTSTGMLIKDLIPEGTTYVKGSSTVTGGLDGYLYGGSNADLILYRPGDVEYNPDAYIGKDGYLTWVIDLTPEELGKHTITIKFDVTVNDRLAEDFVIGNIAFGIPDPSRPYGGTWSSDLGSGGVWKLEYGGGTINWIFPGGDGWESWHGSEGTITWESYGGSTWETHNWPGGSGELSWWIHGGGGGLDVNVDADETLARYVAYEKYSTEPWDGSDETKRLNWDYPENAWLISNGDYIDYYIDLWIPEGSFPEDYTGPTSRYVNVTDILPYITVQKYEDKYNPGLPRKAVGRTELATRDDGSFEINISRSDGVPYTDYEMGFDGDKIYWNCVEVPYGVTVTLHFKVKAEVDGKEMTVNRESDLLIENKAVVSGRETNSVFHRIGRPYIVAEKYVGIINEETNELEWVQTESWIDGLTGQPSPEEQVFVGIGQVFPYKISLGNVGDSRGSIMIRDQINSLLRVVEADIGNNGMISSIQVLGKNQKLINEISREGQLLIEKDPNNPSVNITWLNWDEIEVEPGTAVINGWLYNKVDPDDPRTWIHMPNDPDDLSTTVAGLNFTITDPVDIIFYVQVIGDPDQGQQIPNHALFNFPYLEDNEMAGMGRTNQVDVYVQRTLLVARQSANLPEIPDGAQISNSLEQGRVERGQEITYTIEVANAGGADGFVEIAFPIPEGMIYIPKNDDGSPVVEKRTITRYDNNKPYTVNVDVLVWDCVIVPTSDAGKGLMPKATGEVVIGEVDNELYIGIGSVEDTHATARLMPWSEAGLASVTFTLKVAEDELYIDESGEVIGILAEGILNGSRIDSRPSVTEIAEYDIPLMNIQPIKVYKAVLSHFVPLAEVFGTKTASFEIDGKSITIGRDYVVLDGIITPQDYIVINGERIALEDYEDMLIVERGTKITYELTAYNYGLTRGITYIWDQVPLHTKFDEASNNIVPDNDNILLWTVVVPPLADGVPGIVTKSFTVTVSEDIANGVTVENMATIAGEYTNKLIFNTYLPEIEAVKLVSIDGGETYIDSDGETDIFGKPGIPVELGMEVEYKIILTNVGLGKGIVRIEDQINPLLQVDKGSISLDSIPYGNLVNSKIIWEDVIIDKMGTAELTFKATVGFAQNSGFNPPEQGTVIPNEAIYNNAKQENAINPDSLGFAFGGTIGLGLARTNSVNLIIQREIISVTQKSAKVSLNMPTSDITNEVLPGEQITYTITVRNDGGADKAIIIENPVPIGVTLDSGSISNNGIYKNGIITWEVVLEADSEIVRSFTVTVNSNIANGAQIHNEPKADGRSAIPAAIIYQVPVANISGSEAAKVQGADIGADEVPIGGFITYTITLTNSALVNGTILVTNQVPSGTALVSGSISGSGKYYDEYALFGSNGTPVQVLRNVIVWEDVAVAKNNEAATTLSFTVEVQNLPNGEIIRSTAQYGKDWTDEVCIKVLAPEFSGAFSSNVEKDTDKDIFPIMFDQVVKYSVEVENIGGAPGPVVVTSQIPSGMTYIAGTATPDKYNVLTWELYLEVGEIITVEYEAKVEKLPHNRVVSNSAKINGMQTNIVDLTVLAANLSATLTANSMRSSQVVVGDVLVYTITLNNDGAVDVLADAAVTTPDGMKFIRLIEPQEDYDAYYDNGSDTSIWRDVLVSANGGMVEISFEAEVTGLTKTNKPFPKGQSMVSRAYITNRFTGVPFFTNEVRCSFAPEEIYPGIRLQVLGHVDQNMDFVPAINGTVNGAGTTDGLNLKVTFDNVGGSISTTHVPMENYQIEVVLPLTHFFDTRGAYNQKIDFTPYFELRDSKGVVEKIIPIPLKSSYTQDDPYTVDTRRSSVKIGSATTGYDTITWTLNGSEFAVPQGYQASIVFYSRTLNAIGSYEPKYIEAYLYPNQNFNANIVTKGRVTTVGNEETGGIRTGLVSYASVFIVGSFTTSSYIEAEDRSLGSSAYGNNSGGNVAVSTTDGDIIYTMLLMNTSKSTFTDLTVIGRMPHIGDSVVINSIVPRNSEFDVDFVGIKAVYINGRLVPADKYTIEYMFNTEGFSYDDWNGRSNWLSNQPWSDPSDDKEGQSYRITFSSDVQLQPDACLKVELDARMPSEALAGDRAWMSFAYQYRPRELPSLLLKSEVSVVGVQMAGFNVTKEVEGLYDGSEFVIVVEGEFRDSTDRREITFTAEDVRNGVKKFVPDLIVGNSYTIFEPNPGSYQQEIDHMKVVVSKSPGDDSIRLVTVTNTAITGHFNIVNTVEDYDDERTVILMVHGKYTNGTGNKILTITHMDRFSGRVFTQSDLEDLPGCNLGFVIEDEDYTVTQIDPDTGAASVHYEYKYNRSASDLNEGLITASALKNNDEPLIVTNVFKNGLLEICNVAEPYYDGVQEFTIIVEGKFTDGYGRKEIIISGDNVIHGDYVNDTDHGFIKVQGVIAGETYIITQSNIPNNYELVGIGSEYGATNDYYEAIAAINGREPSRVIITSKFVSGDSSAGSDVSSDLDGSSDSEGSIDEASSGSNENNDQNNSSGSGGNINGNNSVNKGNGSEKQYSYNNTQSIDFDQMIIDQLNRNQNPNVNIKEYNTLTLRGSTLLRMLKSDKTLTISNGNIVTLVLNPINIAELKLNANDKIRIDMSLKNNIVLEQSKLQADKINKIFSKQFVELTVFINNVRVNRFISPLTIRYDLKDFKLTDKQKRMLTGVHLSQDVLGQLGGRFISNNIFEVKTSKLGIHGVLATDSIVRIFAAIRQYSYLLNGNRVVLDALSEIKRIDQLYRSSLLQRYLEYVKN